MANKQEIRNITLEELVNSVKELASKGYRLVQMSCTNLGENMQLNYSFDKDYEFINLRLEIPSDTQVQSISDIYWSAVMYENEIHDLFGMKFEGMAMDFKGNLYRTSVKMPFGSC
ncbi:NADH-quinone oxidoreductase subunit C [Acetivibrio clariflavus]|uniref:NADH-quinone oxidoreductase subunit C n=1 Tax=Acetivibrio clariflavus TaxID=288965 RepID=UPI000488FE79|nr:NADH-quinone oxidoreductase subunit C [Acetivibrio clariflavus]